MELDLRKARLLKGYTQSQMANLLDVHPHTYMKWEHKPDTVTVGKAKAISETLGFSYDLIFFSGKSNLIR
ncbi:transcriptional regulator [Bacillus cereus]|uniref:Transcriptional regulator n=1 Tax=Bacillus cereus TaxID=1396 RepID=A0A9X7GWW8_BACCE|nr:helix-turn-helix transcriptional regulator [Bacillus cereus]PGS80825.1 transcriptional regulator [Bacillus cereus]